jgi:hypothetical protein
VADEFETPFSKDGLSRSRVLTRTIRPVATNSRIPSQNFFQPLELLDNIKTVAFDQQYSDSVEKVRQDYVLPRSRRRIKNSINTGQVLFRFAFLCIPFLLFAAAVKFTSREPIFFRQVRICSTRE